MSSKARPDFVHRPNRNRAIESVCNRCNAIVATSQVRADLERAEQEHVCETRLLAGRTKPPQREHPKAPAHRSGAA